MDLNLREAARLLELDENELYHLARAGELPCVRVHDQYCFNRAELQEWAVARGRCLAPEAAQSPIAGLRAALERGGIHGPLPGTTREEVLAAVTRLATIPPAADRGLLLELLVAREALASTGIGGGVAVPHPRDPLVMGVDEPVLVLCLLEHSVDFGAIDGQPVHALFTLLSPSVRQHLLLLGKLAYALHDDPLRHLLRERAPAAAILARLAALDEAPAAPAGARR
ncbi:MAG TPA: PTS sugar transporter subunit IIA [Polyangia bacterium]|jgi:PTS system nitrogen regulatory IIA component